MMMNRTRKPVPSESDDAVEQEGGGDDDAEEEPFPAKRTQIRPNYAF